MVRTLEDLYDICMEGALQVMPAQIALAHFDLLDHVFGSWWRGVAASQAGLEHLMPEQAADEEQVVVSFGGVRLYQSCRSAIHKLIVSLVQTEDTDGFQILRILGAEAQVGSGLSDLKVPLERTFGIGVKFDAAKAP